MTGKKEKIVVSVFLLIQCTVSENKTMCISKLLYKSELKFNVFGLQYTVLICDVLTDMFQVIRGKII